MLSILIPQSNLTPTILISWWNKWFYCNMPVVSIAFTYTLILTLTVTLKYSDIMGVNSSWTKLHLGLHSFQKINFSQCVIWYLVSPIVLCFICKSDGWWQVWKPEERESTVGVRDHMWTREGKWMILNENKLLSRSNFRKYHGFLIPFNEEACRYTCKIRLLVDGV